MDRPFESCPRRVSVTSWLALVFALSLGALLMEWLIPQAKLAIARTVGSAAIPAGLEVFLGTSWIAWCLPIGALVICAASFKMPQLRQSGIIGLVGALGVAFYVYALGAMGLYFFLINSSYAGNHLFNRLPDQANEILDAAISVTIYELDAKELEPSGGFRGYSVKRRLEIGSAQEAQKLLASVLRDIEASDGKASFCFEPAHGLSVKSTKGTVDLLICYACWKLEYWVDGENDRLGIHKDSQSMFEELFKAAESATPAAQEP